MTRPRPPATLALAGLLALAGCAEAGRVSGTWVLLTLLGLLAGTAGAAYWARAERRRWPWAILAAAGLLAYVLLAACAAPAGAAGLRSLAPPPDPCETVPFPGTGYSWTPAAGRQTCWILGASGTPEAPICPPGSTVRREPPPPGSPPGSTGAINCVGRGTIDPSVLPWGQTGNGPRDDAAYYRRYRNRPRAARWCGPTAETSHLSRIAMCRACQAGTLGPACNPAAGPTKQEAEDYEATQGEGSPTGSTGDCRPAPGNPWLPHASSSGCLSYLTSPANWCCMRHQVTGQCSRACRLLGPSQPDPPVPPVDPPVPPDPGEPICDLPEVPSCDLLRELAARAGCGPPLPSAPCWEGGWVCECEAGP